MKHFFLLALWRTWNERSSVSLGENLSSHWTCTWVFSSCNKKHYIVPRFSSVISIKVVVRWIKGHQLKLLRPSLLYIEKKRDNLIIICCNFNCCREGINVSWMDVSKVADMQSSNKKAVFNISKVLSKTVKKIKIIESVWHRLLINYFRSVHEVWRRLNCKLEIMNKSMEIFSSAFYAKHFHNSLRNGEALSSSGRLEKAVSSHWIISKPRKKEINSELIDEDEGES